MIRYLPLFTNTIERVRVDNLPLVPLKGGGPPLWVRTLQRDGRASQEASHQRAVRTWDRLQSYHTRSCAVESPD